MRHALRARTRVPAATPRVAAARSLTAAALALGLAALLAPGCALLPCRPPAPPKPLPGYDRLRDSLAGVDASGLAGRRIVLDPGHGGVFRGALGVNGLTEAEVNLGVALALRDLLVARGARVLMTRETDRDFLTPADSSLRADLAERARIARAFDPDLFVSIHHNADAGGAHDVNETQTYYKLGDDGPSLDVAQDVHRALVRNVGIATNKVVPGNFYVLRTSDAPAVLTETSYITYPPAEKRLERPDKRLLEAQALFVGLARYFARPVPVIETFAADTAGDRPPGGPSGAGPTLRARVRGAFDTARLEVDGVERSLNRGDSLLWWRPAEALPAGAHGAVLSVRRAGTGAAQPRRVGFDVHRALVGFETEVRPAVLDSAGGLAVVRVRPLDAFGLPVPDTIRVRVRAQRPGDAPADTELVIAGGEGWLHARIAPRRDARDGVAGFEGRAWQPPWRSSLPPMFVAQVEFRRSARDPRPRALVARLSVAPGDTALRDARVAASDARAWLDPDGYAVFELDSAGRAIVPALPGYRAVSDSVGGAGALPLRWAALCGGALHGRRVVLDPEGGGEDAAGQGPGGTRGARLNLESARILAGFLRAAGAGVRLTHEGDLAVSDVERVQDAEAFHAERFLRIAHRAGAARFGYYPGSAGGRAWAEHGAAALAALGLPVPAVGEDAAYVVRQTSCPSLVASPASLGSAASEERLLGPGALRAEAYALFVALAREWAPGADWPLDSLTVLDAGGRPVPGAAVVLGGALVLETDALGRARFLRTEPGGIEAVVEDPRVRARTVLLESRRGAVLTGNTGR